MILRLSTSLLLLLITSREVLACSNGAGLVSQEERKEATVTRFRSDNDITGDPLCDMIIIFSMLIGMLSFILYVAFQKSDRDGDIYNFKL